MNNGAINKAFLAETDAATRTEVLSAIAAHYGCSAGQAEAEVTDEEAEHLLDYLTGSVRTATSLLMKRHGRLPTPESQALPCSQPKEGHPEPGKRGGRR